MESRKGLKAGGGVQAEMACQMEITHRWEEAERQRVIDEAREQMEQEQQEEMQAQARAVTVMQGSAEGV